MRRSIFILSILISLLIIRISAPAGVMAQVVSVEVSAPVAVQEPPPEEYIPEGDPTPPPALTVQNPDLVVVPSGEAQVYMVPNMVGVYFYGGHWYRYHHGVWFSANVYNEPWVVMQTPVVPSFVVSISPAYAFYLPRDYHRIHYGEFHSHWHTWDREKHWHNEHWFKNERRAEVRHARERQAHARMEKDRHQRQERVKADKVGYKNRLADPARHNKPTLSDKTGKIDKTGRTDRTSKIDKTGSTTGSTTKTGGITKTGGATTKTGGIDTTKTGSTTKTGGITKTGGATTKINNQPKLQPKPQPKLQPRPQVQPKPQAKTQPKPKDCKDGKCGR